eukprot:TRINITY_DN10724_c0_g1_i1.p1 TRINITY_DN10724_c0_g1~~TRINITY_DN10724_c0_g1_i1.p1  ORF type:complete len:1170 (-),score=185.03 TRINITY_DN10724_c0_g1_i1:703-4212(-)
MDTDNWLEVLKDEAGPWQDRDLVVLSLFDGLGAVWQALTNLGIPFKGYSSEVEETAVRVVETRWPSVRHLGDVTRITRSDFIGSEPIDLVVGGFPCQDLSGMNHNRVGLHGERSGLFFTMLRLIRDLEPKWFVAENVDSMIWFDRHEISKYLGVTPMLVNCAEMTAQARNRLFWTNLPLPARQPSLVRHPTTQLQHWLDLGREARECKTNCIMKSNSNSGLRKGFIRRVIDTNRGNALSDIRPEEIERIFGLSTGYTDCDFSDLLGVKKQKRTPEPNSSRRARASSLGNDGGGMSATKFADVVEEEVEGEEEFEGEDEGKGEDERQFPNRSQVATPLSSDHSSPPLSSPLHSASRGSSPALPHGVSTPPSAPGSSSKHMAAPSSSHGRRTSQIANGNHFPQMASPPISSAVPSCPLLPSPPPRPTLLPSSPSARRPPSVPRPHPTGPISGRASTMRGLLQRESSLSGGTATRAPLSPSRSNSYRSPPLSPTPSPSVAWTSQPLNGIPPTSAQTASLQSSATVIAAVPRPFPLSDSARPIQSDACKTISPPSTTHENEVQRRNGKHIEGPGIAASRPPPVYATSGGSPSLVASPSRNKLNGTRSGTLRPIPQSNGEAQGLTVGDAIELSDAESDSQDVKSDNSLTIMDATSNGVPREKTILAKEEHQEAGGKGKAGVTEPVRSLLEPQFGPLQQPNIPCSSQGESLRDTCQAEPGLDGRRVPMGGFRLSNDCQSAEAMQSPSAASQQVGGNNDQARHVLGDEGADAREADEKKMMRLRGGGGGGNSDDAEGLSDSRHVGSENARYPKREARTEVRSYADVGGVDRSLESPPSTRRKRRRVSPFAREAKRERGSPIPTGERRSDNAVIRWSLLGNSFPVPVIAYVLSPLLKKDVREGAKVYQLPPEVPTDIKKKNFCFMEAEEVWALHNHGKHPNWYAVIKHCTGGRFTYENVVVSTKGGNVKVEIDWLTNAQSEPEEYGAGLFDYYDKSNVQDTLEAFSHRVLGYRLLNNGLHFIYPTADSVWAISCEEPGKTWDQWLVYVESSDVDLAMVEWSSTEKNVPIGGPAGFKASVRTLRKDVTVGNMVYRASDRSWDVTELTRFLYGCPFTYYGDRNSVKVEYTGPTMTRKTKSKKKANSKKEGEEEEEEEEEEDEEEEAGALSLVPFDGWAG